MGWDWFYTPDYKKPNPIKFSANTVFFLCSLTDECSATQEHHSEYFEIMSKRTGIVHVIQQLAYGIVRNEGKGGGFEMFDWDVLGSGCGFDL